VVLLGSPADGGQMFLVTHGSFVHVTSALAMIGYTGFCLDHPQTALGHNNLFSWIAVRKEKN
jgi:hypothetical protein